MLAGLLFGTLTLGQTAHAATTKITITPSTGTVASGHTITFVAQAVDATNTSTDVTGSTVFSTNDPKASISGATYTGGEAGSWTVQASYQSFLASATLTVTPGEVAEVVINPNSDPEIVLTGTTKKFSAQAFDRNSNLINGTTATWSVIGPIGTINSSGIFTPTALGTGKIQASVGSVIGQIPVTVQAAPVTNANQNANTSTNRNTNAAANRNTNAATNGNTNDSANTNGHTNVAATGTTPQSTTQCTTLKPWVWTLILVIFLIAVAILYGLVPVTKIWPVVVALVGAAVLAYLQRKYDCALQSWWAWVITLGTVALSGLAIRSNPPKSQP